MIDIIDVSFLGIDLWRYVAFFLILFSSLVGKKVFDRYLSKTLLKLTKKTTFVYDDLLIEAITPPVSILFISAGLFFAVSILNIPSQQFDIQGFLLQTLKVITSIIFVWIFYRLCSPVSAMLKDFMSKSDEELAMQFAPIMQQALRVTVVVVGGILIIQNLGYSVSSLIAGLGVGGLAVALAAKDTISNLFGTFVMFTDSPFRVGDWVQFKNVDGDVESIGFRSTKIRTWAKSLVVIPNKILTSEIIENWSVMPKRRVKMTIGLTYDSPPEKIEEFIKKFREILKNDDGVNQDYILVNFTGFGASQLDIFIYYFTSSTVWAEYLEIRQRINIKMINLVHELGLKFAFPSQSIYFENDLNTKGDFLVPPQDDPTLPT